MKRITLLLSSLLLFVVLKGNLTEGDSLLSELTFSNNLEKEVFTHFLKEDSTDLYALFYTLNFEGTLGDITSNKRKLDQYSFSFKSEKFNSLKNAKKAKVLYKDVHDKYFTKYETISFFNEIHSSGKYNCVSATALYGIIFDELDLDYNIQLLPNHVYLVLFPDEEAIPIETTNPLKGYKNHDSKTKRDYVRFLKDSKLISEVEYNSYSVDELFEKYFYANKLITLKNLVGVQYFNAGLSLFTEEKWEEAFNEFEKASVFFYDEKLDFMLMASLNNYLVEESKYSFDRLKYILKISKYIKGENKVEVVLSQFSMYIDHFLINNSDVPNLTKSYNYLSGRISDSTLKNEIDFLYHYEVGRYYLLKGFTKKSNDYFIKALNAKPKNIDAQTAFLQTLAQRMENMGFEASLEFLTKCWEDYPDLHSNNMFREMLGSAFLYEAIDLFNDRQIKEGLNRLDAFEELVENYESITINSDLVGDAYSSAAAYYFRIGNYKKARAMVNQGLSYSPNNYRLKRALNSF